MSVRKLPWRPVFFALAAGWMLFIFLMSASPGPETENASGRLAVLTQKIFFRRWESFPEDAFARSMGKLNYLLRKAAHFSEFAVLGALLSLALMTYEKPFGFRFAAAFLTGTAYAGLDEVHQLFVSGRDGAVFDVLVDSSGVLAGCLLVLGIFAMVLADRKGRKGKEAEERTESGRASV